MTKGQKLSALGLVLMGASAVCAFVMPKAEKKVFANGHLEFNSTTGGVDNQATCKSGVINGVTKCDFTLTDNGSFTSAANVHTSDDVLGSTGATNTGMLNDGNDTMVSRVS
jgi:hypothetical protein